MKGRWDAQKSVGAKTRLSEIKPQLVKPQPDSSEHLLGLSSPFLVPFAPLYEELNGSLDSEERRRFAVMKSVERQCEFYSMAHQYTANMQNELQEVEDGMGRRKLYQRYTSSLLILATKLYNEWTKDVLDWKAPTDEDEVSNNDGSDDDDEDEGETNTRTDSLPAIGKITETRTHVVDKVSLLYLAASSEGSNGREKVAPSLHSISNNAKKHREGAKANLDPKYTTTPPNFAWDNMKRLPLQKPITRDRQPEAAKARPGQKGQSDPGGEHGDLWPPGVFRAVYFPPAQSVDSKATFQSRGEQEPDRSHPQRSSRNRTQSGGFVSVNTNTGPRKGGLESPFGSLHSSRPAMDARSLLSKENIDPARGYPDLSDKERRGKASLISSPLHHGNSMRSRTGPVPAPVVAARVGHQSFPFPPPPRQTIPARGIVHRGEYIESLSPNGGMTVRLGLMEEGKAGYDSSESQASIQNEGKVMQGSARGSHAHGVESINDTSSIDITESEDEESDTPAPSLAFIALKSVPKVDLGSRRLATGILRGTGTRPNTPTPQRFVQFQNSPDVRYI